MSNTNIKVIPNDIVIEILVRVPAKSLLRLRWTCLYWLDLITRDDDFIKKNYLLHHTTATTNSTHDNDDRIISNTSFWISNSKTVVCTTNLGDFVNINDHHGRGGTSINMDCYNLPFYNLYDDDHVEFCGSCNGLVLFVLHRGWPRCNNDTYFLWNPCTREVRELGHEPLNFFYEHRVLGFGYDHILDDYKVMRILLNYYKYGLEISISVYTLGSNSWSRKFVTDDLLRADHLKKQIQKLGVLVNGALHWTDEDGIGTITSFDITKEELREIQGPNKEDLMETESPITYVDAEPTSFTLILCVLNGCLCMCRMPHDFTENYVIWMMKDYGVKDSWTKLFTMDMEKVLAAPSQDGMLRYNVEPFEQYYKDGGILMVFNRNARDMIIVAYDLKKNDKARFIYSIQDDHDEHRLVNGTYTESLVSLNSGMYLTLAAGSRAPTFQKQDLSEYKVKCERGSNEKKILVKKLHMESKPGLTRDRPNVHTHSYKNRCARRKRRRMRLRGKY